MVALTACAPQSRPAPQPAAPDYLYVWASAIDTTRGSFLGVFDISEDRKDEERLVSITAAPKPSHGAHHVEHELGRDGRLFANAFGSGTSFLFDLSSPVDPRIVKTLGDVGPFSNPHSYARLANGNVIATFQSKIGGGLPGGLAELDNSGHPVRWASAATTEADSLQIVPYSVVAVPTLDRLVSTSTHMTEDIGVHIQIWRLSDLKLLRTLAVPRAASAPSHTGHAAEQHRYPSEPRVLANGRTVMFGTFTCGLYHITGLDSANPKVVFSSGFPGADCAVPVVIGKYWIQTVPALHALVSLDVSDPAKPVEVSRLVFGAETKPHWLAADASGRRLVMTSASRLDPTLHLIEFNRATGSLTRRRTPLVLTLRNLTWPDGYRGDAVPHGVVFSRRRY